MKIYFDTFYHGSQCRVFLLDQQEQYTVFYTFEEGQLVAKKVDRYDASTDAPPFMVIPYRMKDEIVQAFVAAAAGLGLKSKNENLLEGKLEATQLHLSDMRELTKQLIGSRINENQQPLV